MLLMCTFFFFLTHLVSECRFVVLSLTEVIYLFIEIGKDHTVISMAQLKGKER